MIHEHQQKLIDSVEQVKYKVIGKDGKEITVRDSQMLAEMYINQLPEELREGCRVVPITTEGKQLLFG